MTKHLGNANTMTHEERSRRLKSLLKTIAPEGSLENLKRDPLDTQESLRTIDEATAVAGTHLANEGLGNLARDEQPAPDQLDALEAIILPRERPVVFIVDGDFMTPPEPWSHFGDAPNRERIKSALPSIGRIELPSQPLIPYGGTGFVVGRNLLMTNRHVAELFASGLGQSGLVFKPGQTAGWDFKQEHGQPSSNDSVLAVRRVVMIHPYWDMALLQVDGLPAGHEPILLSVTPPEGLVDREIALIGYPAKDWRSNLQLQDQIFQGAYNVKRLQPGKIRSRGQIESFGHDVNAMTHDSSTLGGNSGSAIVDVQTGQVVGLHFAGIYLKANYAVPAFELARDARCVDAGLNFASPVARDAEWGSYWTQAGARTAPLEGSRADAARAKQPITQSPPAAPGNARQPSAPIALAGASVPSLSLAQPVSGTQGTSIQIDSGAVRVAITLGPPPSQEASAERAGEAIVEKLQIDSDYSNREGYDPKFLGNRSKMIPLPQLTTARQRKAAAVNDQADGAEESLEFPYHHFSIVMNADRRLAFFTAVNIDGSQSKRPKRTPDSWIFDPRLPAAQQLGNDFYGKPFDRGHLVRRIDPTWGRSKAVITAANNDTFHFTNCSPQHARFNEGKNLWAGLEDYVLDTADNQEQKVTVFSGPIFAEDDPEYDDVQIPKEFWKVMVFVNPDGKLSATGYIVSQEDLLKSEGIEKPADVARTFQVAVRTVAARTRLDFGDLPDHDPFAAHKTTEGIEAPPQPLEEYAQIVL